MVKKKAFAVSKGLGLGLGWDYNFLEVVQKLSGIMVETLAKKSDFLRVKYKFFLNRAVTYFSFLLIPIWVQKTVQLNLFLQSTILIFYIMFMVGQWYLLGKEIDHRLKIYYRVNSSMDRIIYRILVGNIVVILFFNFLRIFPEGVTKFIFWFFFFALGLFYSWPTRGKIIEESMAGQFGEFRFLDNFERTVLVMTLMMFLVSIPEIPLFQNIEALILYLDPGERVHSLIWNFLKVNYLPFDQYPKLFNLAWSFNFYMYGLGLFLLTFYSVLRFFFARRLALLGVFALVSSWSFTRILAQDFLSSVHGTFPILFVWSLLWSSKSASYRSGLATGLIAAYGTMINAYYVFLFPISCFGMVVLFMKDKTRWYKRQWLKYNLFGAFLALVVVFTHQQGADFFRPFEFTSVMTAFGELIYRKAFYSISVIGLILLGYYIFLISYGKIVFVGLDRYRLKELGYGVFSLLILSLCLNPVFINNFTSMWILTIFSLIPLEWVFQSISRLRSKRNAIYVLYILVCLLDSHFEGRVRTVAKMFLKDDVYKFINQI